MARDAAGVDDQIFMRQKAVAELLGVSQRTLERWRLEGCGPAYRKWAGGRLVAYARSDVLALADAQRRTSTSDSGPAGSRD